MQTPYTRGLSPNHLISLKNTIYQTVLPNVDKISRLLALFSAETHHFLSVFKYYSVDWHNVPIMFTVFQTTISVYRNWRPKAAQQQLTGTADPSPVTTTDNSINRSVSHPFDKRSLNNEDFWCFQTSSHNNMPFSVSNIWIFLIEKKHIKHGKKLYNFFFSYTNIYQKWNYY